MLPPTNGDHFYADFISNGNGIYKASIIAGNAIDIYDLWVTTAEY
jgi:hypothetical protein